MAKRVAFAIAAHPDDIELMMAGTLSLLGRAGFELHMMNIANGSCGSMTEGAMAIAARRLQEAHASANVLGGELHPPLANDIEIFYEERLLRRVAALIREVAPTILLLQSPVDYMEDHTNACRLGVTAAFVRGMPNFVTEPRVAPVDGEVTVYHSLPWGLRGPLGEAIAASHYVNVETVMSLKHAALACHRSQKEWLDRTQGLNSYLQSMEDMAKQVGRASGRFAAAEGWRRHLHLGFCAEHADPLREALGELVYVKEGAGT